MKTIKSKWNSLDAKTHLVEYTDGSIERKKGTINQQTITAE